MIKKQLKEFISKTLKIQKHLLTDDYNVFDGLSEKAARCVIIEIEDLFDIEVDKSVSEFISNFNTLEKISEFIKLKIQKTEYKNAASSVSLIYVNKNDELLLVERKRNPFQGFWALPGGFLNCDQETLEEAAKREFFEETNLIIHELELLCVNSEPNRDPRGHVIDHVYVVLSCDGNLEAKDDAKKVKFFKLTDLPKLAFDHEKSIKKTLSLKNNLKQFLDQIKVGR